MSAYRLYLKNTLPDGTVVYDTGATLPGCSLTNQQACDPVEFATLQEVLDYAAARGEVPRECVDVNEVWQIVASGEQPAVGMDTSSMLLLGGGLLLLFVLTKRRRG
jgi:hypothetical protein